MSLRSAMAEHFAKLDRMQGGGTVAGTTGEMWGSYNDLLRNVQNADATGIDKWRYILTVAADRGGPRDVTNTSYAANTRARLQISLDQANKLYDAMQQRRKQLSSPAAGAAATGGTGQGLLTGLSKIFARAKEIGSTLGEAAADTGAWPYGVDTTVGGDTYHSPEWRRGELELMQEQNQLAREAQAAQQRSDRATLAERMGEIEAAEQQSRRGSLLEAAKALFAAAGTAAPPGMVYYPGFEPGGAAEVSARNAGDTVPASLLAPISRKPVSFDVLNAFDLNPLKQQIAAIMGGNMPGAKKGLVSMAGGGTVAVQNLARALQGKSAEDQKQIINWVTTSGAVDAADAADVLKWVNTSTAGGSAAEDPYSLNAIIGQAIYELERQHEFDTEQLRGATIPSVRNAIAQVMGYNDTGQPTMDMRSLLAGTKANPRNIIEGLFLGRGMGLPADLSNVEAVEGGWQVGGGGAGGGGGGTTPSADPLQGASSAADLAARRLRNPARWQSPSGSWWQSQGDYDRQQTRNVAQRASSADALARMRAGTWTSGGRMAAEGKVVSGPAISTVGERGGDAGTEYAYLPPGAVVAPKPAGEKPSMDGALRAIAAQLFKSGLGGAPSRMATGGSVFSPTVTGSLPRSLLDAPALRAFMSPSNAGLPSVHKLPTLFQPFGAGGPEAPNWLDPRAILAFAHADPTEQDVMKSLTSAFGNDPATALEMGRRAMAGFGAPITARATYRPYWSW